ncbi:MAG: LPS-assembly protein LptD, partial [Deltaproteobacteria bacterium]|nr:LPS-assembly protein LptD [Deltaproteobacteria bacterium]
PVQVTADRLEYEAARSLFIAEGHVRIVNGDRSIDADWVVVSRETERGIASGHVIYRDSTEELQSEFLQFDINTLQGLIYQAHLDTGEGGFLVDADRLIRTGDKSYTVRSGTFTTCRCPEGEEDPWRIQAGKADVKVGGYATAQNTTVEILGVPVVWLPWLIFPVKTERETGVLFPHFGLRGDAGFEVGLPLFWAARQNLNVVATPIYMTKRGFKQNLEFEYLIGQKSKGKIFGAYGRDQKRIDDKPAGGSEGDEDRVGRWTVLADHDQWLPGGWRAKAELNLISDNDYVEDYVELSAFRHDLFIDSTIFGFRQFGEDGRLGVVGSAIYTDDLQARDSRDRDAFVHQQLPSIHAEVLSGRSIWADGVVTRLEFDYTNFYSDELPQNEYGDDEVHLTGDDLFLDIGVDALPERAESGFDVAAGEESGVFEEGEPLADRGHRFIFHPRVAYPLRLWDRIEVYPEVGYRETLYTTHAQSFAEQGHLTARVDLRSRLAGQLGESRSHVVEPLIGWSMVANVSDSGDPLFVPATALPQYRLRQFERDNLLADPSDRVNSRNTFTVGVGNRLYSRNRLLGELNLSLDYHMLGDGTKYSVTQGQDDFSRFVVAGETRRFYRTSTSFNLTFDPEDERVEEGLFTLTVAPWSWLALQASYRYRAPIPAETARFFSQIDDDDPWSDKTDALSQIRPLGVVKLGENLRLKYAANYDLAESRLLKQQGTIEYRSKCNCWALGVEVQEQKSGEIRYQLRYSLLGSGDDGLRAKAFERDATLGGF